ncbi:iron complex outermembrane receptor protein [Povalibacter uvarum]|uniref:Iron complex outermembrane receptor protein n=1 Tax=Povalibacter uvarum TaxID=732238 RepID=A0A841HS66_9GAMM|nr:TonB-dependent receptor [Povalibacter uvarum]MBB6095494.1 iron complex outermembrane receptor protein [Povalibacter uvarum]
MRSYSTALAALLGAAAPTIYAQDVNTAVAGAAGEGVLDTVVVLGTARQDTTALTSTAPVDVITPEQLRETGAVTINQALSKLHPSFNFPQGQNAVKGQGVRAASLRGVGPAYTLILVNGKRRNVSAQLSGTDPWPAAQVVDLNVLPVSAVQRVEVLRDGAAAQYGSDAIAGVVNIVLKDNSSGGDVTANVGEYTDGGGFTRSVNGWTGLSIGDNGFVTLSADFLKNDNVDRSEEDWRQLFPNGDPRNETFDKKYGQWGQQAREHFSALVNAGYEFSDSVSAYGWANYAHKEGLNYVNPERIVKAVTSNPTGTDGTRISETAVLGVYPDIYQPYMTYTAEDIAAVAGLRFSNESFGELDTAVSFGQNETGRHTYSTINPSLGPDSPTDFYLGSWQSRTTSVTSDYRKELPVGWVESLVASAGALFRHEYWGTEDLGDPRGYNGGPLAGLTVAQLYGPGGIYNQYVSQFPGVNFADTSRIPATGSSTAGIRAEDAGSITRNVKGGYVGFDAAVTDKFDVGLTARYEDYSDFGDTSNYRLTARYEFIPALALRGTVSTGFHAPSLAQLGNQSSGYTSNWSNSGTGVFAPGRTRVFRTADPTAAAFGAKPLEPEESTTYSVGFVIRPDSSSSITIDAYRLQIDDVIQVTETLQGPTVTAAFNAAGLNGYTQASYYWNAWDAKTDGVDLVARKQFDFANSTLDLTAAASWLDTEVSDVNREVTIGGAPLIAIRNAKIRDAETGTPSNKVILNGRYTIGAWAADATVTRYDEYRYNVGDVAGVAAANGNVDQIFSPETYLDLGVSYQSQGAWRVDVLVQNVLNDYPDKYVNGNRASGINPYSFIAPNGASGRFVQGSFTYSF